MGVERKHEERVSKYETWTGEVDMGSKGRKNVKKPKKTVVEKKQTQTEPKKK